MCIILLLQWIWNISLLMATGGYFCTFFYSAQSFILFSHSFLLPNSYYTSTCTTKLNLNNSFVVFDFSVRCPLQINQIKSTWGFCHTGKYLSYTSVQSVTIESLSPEMTLGRLIPDKAAVWIIPQQRACYAIPTFLRKKSLWISELMFQGCLMYLPFLPYFLAGLR